MYVSLVFHKLAQENKLKLFCYKNVTVNLSKYNTTKTHKTQNSF